MKLRPVNDKVVIRQKNQEDDNVTEGGIILPDIAIQNSLVEGEVIGVGNGMYSMTGEIIPVAVEKGETVLYNKTNSGQEYVLDGETLVILSTNEILSVLEK